MTIKCSTNYHAKLKHDLEKLDIPTESKESLEILLHSLENFIDIYNNLRTTTYSFVDFLRRWR
jgi:hypothetical protein